MMPLVLHVCPTGGNKLGAPNLSYVLARDVEESAEVGCCGDGGTDAEFFLGVWDAADGGATIQVLGSHYIIHTRRLARGGAEYATGMGKVGEDGKDIGDRRGG